MFTITVKDVFYYLNYNLKAEVRYVKRFRQKR